MSSWNHGDDPTAHLKVTHLVDQFKDKLASDPNFLQSKVKEYFRVNQHKLWLVMKPQEDYQEEQESEEKRKLEGMVEGLTEEDRKEIFEKGRLNQDRIRSGGDEKDGRNDCWTDRGK